MTFGEDWEFGASRDESRAMFDAFCEAGGNFIDSANSYTYGTSEKLVGDFVSPHRDRFVIGTKYSLTLDPDDPNGGGNHRKNMCRSVERSLRQLNTDYIDIYWLHAWDRSTGVEEVMRGLDDLVRSGKVLYIGVSDTPAWVISQSNMLAELRGWTRFVGIQIEYNLL
jgi:aryl-alcohol dehydrogenase-like predicted oxidoreductase